MSCLRRKLNNTVGFTLAETLVTVLILLMVSAVLAAGVPAAMNAYRNAVDAANAQTLLSATVNALRGELSTAWKVTTPDDKTIIYRSSDTGSQSKISVNNHVIILQEYYIDATENWLEGDKDAVLQLQPPERDLISRALRRTTRNGNEYMSVEYTSVTSNSGYVEIKGLAVKRGTVTLAEMPDTGLLIRVMSGGKGT